MIKTGRALRIREIDYGYRANFAILFVRSNYAEGVGYFQPRGWSEATTLGSRFQPLPSTLKGFGNWRTLSGFNAFL